MIEEVLRIVVAELDQSLRLRTRGPEGTVVLSSIGTAASKAVEKGIDHLTKKAHQADDVNACMKAGSAAERAQHGMPEDLIEPGRAGHPPRRGRLVHDVTRDDAPNIVFGVQSNTNATLSSRPRQKLKSAFPGGAVQNKVMRDRVVVIFERSL